MRKSKHLAVINVNEISDIYVELCKTKKKIQLSIRRYVNGQLTDSIDLTNSKVKEFLKEMEKIKENIGV